MPNDTLKITYFNGRGRAESLRLACVLGDLEFTDDRFEFAQFPEAKAKTPYSAVPVMEIDGAQFAQTNALLRYLGKETKLYPTCPLMALKVDEALDTMEDFLNCIFRYRGPDKERLREERVKLLEEDVPRYIGGLEKRMADFGDGPFVIGEMMTIADLVLLCHVNSFKTGFLDFIPTDLFDKFPRFMMAYNESMKNEKIIAWYKKNPIKGVTD